MSAGQAGRASPRSPALFREKAFSVFRAFLHPERIGLRRDHLVWGRTDHRPKRGPQAGVERKAGS